MFEVDKNYLDRLSVEQLRAEVHSFAGRWIELIHAMEELPELPSPELLHVLGDFAVRSDHERGKEILEGIIQNLLEVSKVEKAPSMEGLRSMTAVLSPKS